MTPIDERNVVRPNRDTLLSWGVFDLEAAPVTISLPGPGKRFMSMQIISEDHYVVDVVYAPATFTCAKECAGTRYVAALVRTLADPKSAADMAEARALQDAIHIEQAKTGRFEVPRWDPKSRTKVRGALAMLGTTPADPSAAFGAKDRVDPIAHLVGTALDWGGHPREAVVHLSIVPRANDGRTVHRLTVAAVPVDGFWSVSVYDGKGFFAKNEWDAYALNNQTAKPSPDGSFTFQFGECERATPNCLPIVPGWSYTVRLYRPRLEILDGRWKFPDAKRRGSATFLA
jgi:para-nitrobenzyl esterase